MKGDGGGTVSAGEIEGRATTGVKLAETGRSLDRRRVFFAGGVTKGAPSRGSSEGIPSAMSAAPSDGPGVDGQGGDRQSQTETGGRRRFYTETGLRQREN